MFSAKAWNHKGNVAYQLYEWEEAIEAYTESLFLEPKNYVVYSKRAAAYLKSRQPLKALEDANKSLALKPSYHKSYRWKAEAYLALKQPDKAVAAFKEGLKIAPGDDALERGLDRARRVREHSPEGSSSHHTVATVTTTASTTTSTSASASGSSPLPTNHLLPSSPKPSSKSNSRRISMSPQKLSVQPPVSSSSPAKLVSASVSVSTFVRQTRDTLNQQLELVQAKLGLLDRISGMNRSEKLDVLFGLIDNDHSGAVDAEELAVVLRTRNSGLSVGDSVQRAMSMVAAFDVDGNAQLDREEFETFLETMLSHLSIDFDEFTDYLSLHLSFPVESERRSHPDSPHRHGNPRSHRCFSKSQVGVTGPAPAPTDANPTASLLSGPSPPQPSSGSLRAPGQRHGRLGSVKSKDSMVRGPDTSRSVPNLHA